MMQKITFIIHSEYSCTASDELSAIKVNGINGLSLAIFISITY